MSRTSILIAKILAVLLLAVLLTSAALSPRWAARPEDVLATSTYGVEFHAAVQRGNVMGVQFHPEKSGRVGERLLRNFAAMAGEEEH